MQTNNFQLTISGSGYWIPIVILSLLLLPFIISTYLNHSPFDSKISLSNKKWGILLLSLLSLLFIYEVSWLAAKTIINVDAKKMTVTESFYGIPFTKTYDISKISNLKIEHNVSGHWHQGSRFGNGIPLTNDPTVLYFDYDGDTKCIGKHCTNFNAASIITAIQKEQK